MDAPKHAHMHIIRSDIVTTTSMSLSLHASLTKPIALIPSYLCFVSLTTFTSTLETSIPNSCGKLCRNLDLSAVGVFSTGMTELKTNACSLKLK